MVEQQPIAGQAFPRLDSASYNYHGRFSSWVGPHIDHNSVQGVWTPHQQGHHINYLDLLAIYLALKAFLPLIQGKVVLVRTDNMTAMYSLQKRAGRHSLSLSLLARNICHWALCHYIHLMEK